MHSEYFYITIIFIIVISIVIFTVNSDSCGGAEEKYSNNYVEYKSRNNDLNFNKNKYSYQDYKDATCISEVANDFIQCSRNDANPMFKCKHNFECNIQKCNNN